MDNLTPKGRGNFAARRVRRGSERIAEDVANRDRTTGCWNWDEPLKPNEATKLTDRGYGGNCTDAMGKVRSPHVQASTLNGKPPTADKPHIRHVKCGNPACYNPDHLEPGTPQDNMNDMVRDGTSTYGEKSHSAILNEAQVTEIIQSIKMGEPIYILAKRYNVSQGAVAGIKSGRKWKHLPR